MASLNISPSIIPVDKHEDIACKWILVIISYSNETIDNNLIKAISNVCNLMRSFRSYFCIAMLLYANWTLSSSRFHCFSCSWCNMIFTLQSLIWIPRRVGYTKCYRLKERKKGTGKGGRWRIEKHFHGSFLPSFHLITISKTKLCFHSVEGKRSGLFLKR